MPKIIGANLQEHRKQTRRKLFNALQELLTESGFEQITMAQISQRADVGRTAIYNHFPDKEALLLAYVTAATRQHAQNLTDSLAQVADPIDRLRVYIEAQLRLQATTAFVSGASLRGVVTPQTALELRGHASIVEDILRGLLKDAMRAGVILESRIESLVALIHATTAVVVPLKDPHAYAGFIIETEQFLLRALGADAGPVPRERYRNLVELAQLDLAQTPAALSRNSMCPVVH